MYFYNRTYYKFYISVKKFDLNKIAQVGVGVKAEAKSQFRSRYILDRMYSPVLFNLEVDNEKNLFFLKNKQKRLRF